ncbi:MAG: cysteine hydrolase [Thermoflavifilum sp.]|nr:cysteine hydrolase [Thermoflavifilum sp.]MCL6514701.1 cysteine hydrolase [Alicyclobacillus sp.]
MITVKDSRSALIIIDMQEDFCSPEGVYARGGVNVQSFRSILPSICKAMRAAEHLRMPRIASLFTIFEDVDGTPLIAPSLLHKRPFLAKAGFRIGEAGRQFTHELPLPSHTLIKPRYSAFYQTPLDLLLKAMEIQNIAVCGITANGGVAATVRDAHLRDFEITVLADAIASETPDATEHALTTLAEIARIMTVDEWVAHCI